MGRREATDLMLRIFGENFLEYDGAEIVDDLADGSRLSIRNAGSRVHLTLSNYNLRKAWVMCSAAEGLEAFLRFPE